MDHRGASFPLQAMHHEILQSRDNHGLHLKAMRTYNILSLFVYAADIHTEGEEIFANNFFP